MVQKQLQEFRDSTLSVLEKNVSSISGSLRTVLYSIMPTLLEGIHLSSVSVESLSEQFQTWSLHLEQNMNNLDNHIYDLGEALKVIESKSYLWSIIFSGKINGFPG